MDVSFLLRFEIMAGSDICKYVLQRNFWFHKMRWCCKQTATWAGDGEILNGFRIDFLRCAEGEERLRAQSAPEGEAIAVFGVDFCEIHAFRLDRIENIDSRID